jgi:azurin
MSISLSRLSVSVFALVVLGSAGCTKNAEQTQNTETGTTAGSNVTAAASTAETTLEIGSVGDTMAFDKTTLEVKAGSKVTLTLKNNATSPAMKHNWSLVKPGTADTVGVAGIQAGEAKAYIPDSPDVLAHTSLTNPGETATVTFTAPPAGEYPYICTFPGHYALMKGVLKSTP